ncbi:MAG: hypothetical protein ACI8QD_001983 [Cyclobacteriaceae bacterium]|jgi:hypothetical protein
MIHYIHKHQVKFYYLITFSVGWIPIYFITGAPAYSAPVPLLIAIVLRWMFDGKAGLKQIFSQCFSLRIPHTIWLISLLGPIVLSLIPMVIFGLNRGAWPTFSYLQDAIPFLIGLLFWFTPLSGGFLELGFQSFALPLLERRHGPLLGATLVGLLLGCFMLPDFFRPGSPQAQMGNGFIFWFMLSEIGIAYMIAYLCNKSGGRVLAGGYLFHVMNNVFISILLLEQGLSNDKFDPLLLWLIAAAYILGGILTALFTKGQLGYRENDEQAIRLSLKK